MKISCVLLSLVVLLLPNICTAYDDVVRGQGVTQRARSQYSPLGIRIGGFILSPRLVIRGEYEDNVYKRSGNLKQHDYILHVDPSLTLKSNWNRHAVAISANGNITYHDRYKNEDWQDFRVNAKGRYDILNGSFVGGNIRFSRQHEGRGSADSTIGLKEVTRLHMISGDISGQHQINRMRIAVSNNSQYIYYEDSQFRNGRTLNNSDRDRFQNNTTLTLNYKINERYEGFVRGSYDFREYDDKKDDLGVDRSSDGYKAEAGINIELSNKLEGDIFAGYKRQDYAEGSVKGISGGFGLQWFPTGITTVSTKLSRSIEETILNRYLGSFRTNISLRVDHELLRNTLLNVHVGYSNNAYERRNNNNLDNTDREDKTYSLGFGGKYLFTRNLYVKGDYTWTRKDSNIQNDGRDYENNKVYITIGIQL